MDERDSQRKFLYSMLSKNASPTGVLPQLYKGSPES